MPHANALKPIVVKELRETAGLAVIAALVAFFFVTVSMVGVFPWSQVIDNAIPFVTDATFFYLIFVAAALAIALGLRQSAWESHTGTYLFLLHRPIERRWVMAVKIGVGISVYGVAMSLPVLLYACWAATPGTHASPFFWSMTLPLWQTLLTMLLLYLGSFLSGLGEGRWYGTRLLPLAGTAMVTWVLVSTNATWPVVCLCLMVVVAGLLWTAIVVVTTQREYA
jgi:hypothetical protein